MDLPPDKAKLLKSYDDDKKWELICDQVCGRFVFLANLGGKSHTIGSICYADATAVGHSVQL